MDPANCRTRSKNAQIRLFPYNRPYGIRLASKRLEVRGGLLPEYWSADETVRYRHDREDLILTLYSGELASTASDERKNAESSSPESYPSPAKYRPERLT